ncbi:protein scylla-like isoform X2 [Palaemon carinicauda]|uniref:protein scylla-like isoform X2 n=1 Tax=Palaemon carinicauda TaxID=392227 RepID=UPI0035B65792
MAHTKVLSPAPASTLTDLLGPLPTEEDDFETWLEDPTERVTQATLRRRVEEEMRLATDDGIWLPPSLLDQVAEEVLHLSKDEPCGLRGCVVFVTWKDGVSNDQPQPIAQVKADSSTPTTHILVLTLQPDCSSWYNRMARMIRSLDKRERRQLVASPQYELVKRRLCNFEE